MKADRKLIEHVAKIARLNLTEHEIDVFLPQLKEILGAFSAMDSVDVEGIEPSFQPVQLKDALREDVPHQCLSQADALMNSSNRIDGYFKGPGAA